MGSKLRVTWKVTRWAAVRSVPVARVAGALTVAIAWLTFCWCTGRPFSHHPRRRYLQRHVRATLQNAALVVAALLVWQPLATATVLAVAGGALVATAAVTRRRPLPDQRPPIRVESTIDRPQPAATGGGR